MRELGTDRSVQSATGHLQQARCNCALVIRDTPAVLAFERQYSVRRLEFRASSMQFARAIAFGVFRSSIKRIERRRAHQDALGCSMTDAIMRSTNAVKFVLQLRCRPRHRSNRSADDSASAAFAKRSTRPANPCQQLVDGHEVAEALRHLLAFDLQEAVVHPVIRHHRRMEGATRLRDLVLVMRKHQIDAAAVDVEGLAETLPGHGRAFDVPARPARRPDAGRRRPAPARPASTASTARNPSGRCL